MNFKSIQEHVKKAATETRADRIMSRIESEAVTPCPRWQFWCAHWGVWLLWVLSVVAGAIAIAVMLYVGRHTRYALFEATHSNLAAFTIEALPYLWIIIFILTAISAHFNFRHTKRGYRYSLTTILLSSITLSLLGGWGLHQLNFGQYFDTLLGQSMATYPSLERKELELWQAPAEGRLVGQWLGTEDAMMFYDVEDDSGTRWSVTIHELREPDLRLLETGERVRLLGTTTDPTDKQFHACGVFPWMLTQPQPPTALAENRQAFVDRMYDHMEASDRLRALEAEIYPDKPLAEQVFLDGLCGSIAAVSRVQFSQ